MDTESTTACGCGCGSMATVTSAHRNCRCGCECCRHDPKPTHVEIDELTTLKKAIDLRLAELGA